MPRDDRYRDQYQDWDTSRRLYPYRDDDREREPYAPDEDPYESYKAENRELRAHIFELERMQKGFERKITAFEEMERRYGELLDSEILLYALVSPNEGEFLSLNRGMRVFLGMIRGMERRAPKSLLDCCPPDQRDMMRDLLQGARANSFAALTPLIRTDGVPIWLDAEFSPASVRGGAAIRIIGVNVTEWADLSSERQAAAARNIWSGVLDSCPGLLCCVLDPQGRLLYASQGYRSLAARVLGHECEKGQHYPPRRTELDGTLREMILDAARRGEAQDLEVTERYREGQRDAERLWDFTIAPLRVKGEFAGAVLRVLPLRLSPPALPAPAPVHKSEPEQKPLDPAPSPEERRQLLDAVSSRLAVVNDKGVCLAANEAFLASLGPHFGAGPGLSVGVIGTPLLDRIPKDTPVNEAFHQQFPALLAVREGTLICRMPAEKEELLWLEVQARPVEWSDINAVMLTFEDVTRLRRTQEQLKRVRETDYATGILNRQGMERLLRQRVELAIRNRAPLSLMILDIDGFRRLNETEGYAAADRALKALTSAMENVLSQDDIIGRWSGDEFMVLTPRSGLAARLLANSLRDMASSGAFEQANAVTLSVGVAEFSAEMDLSAFVGAAYDSMVLAKRSGGNRTVMTGE